MAHPRMKNRLHPRSLIIAVFLFAVAVMLLLGAVDSSARPTSAVIWGSLSLTSYAAGLLYLVGAEAGVVNWKFGPWTIVFYMLVFGVATMTWSEPQTGLATEISVSSVLRALWLIAVGLSAWTIGYLVGPGYAFRGALARGVTALGRRFTTDVRSPATPWMLYAIAVAARLANAALLGKFGYISDPTSVTTATSYGQVLSLLTICAPLALSAAALQVYCEGLKSARITLAILFPIELAFGAVIGGKGNFVIAVLAIVIPMSTARHRLPLAAVIGGVVVFIAIVIPFNQAYRNSVGSTSTPLTPAQEVSGAPRILRQTLTVHSLVVSLPESVNYLLKRTREIDSPAIIVQRTGQQIPYQSPIQLIEAPLVDVVPRIIWRAKPILATGYQFGQQYYELPPTLYTSSAITPVGDLYRYGGWIPVIAAMFVTGCGLRLLDDVFDVRENPHAISLVLLILPAFVFSEDGWATMLAGLPADALVWLFVVRFTFRRQRTM